MARKIKIIEEKMNIDNMEQCLDRREFGYYSTPQFISDYITRRMIDINGAGRCVLDPCCGKEELLGTFIDKKYMITGMDIIKHKENYFCNFSKQDFIEYYMKRKTDEKEGNINGIELDYDYYIANPPYNCHEIDYIKNNKKDLLKCFFDVGVHNMYSMFISAIIDLAKDDAVIGLITHDSFFTSKHHSGLRKKILDKCSIHEITMCPTDLFLKQGADVRTSIILLQKGRKNQKGILVNNRTINSNQFKACLQNELKYKSNSKCNIEDIVLCNSKDNLEFVIECPKEVRKLFELNRLGEIYRCVTGISTGNDKMYLSQEKKEPYIIPFYKNPGKDRFYTGKVLYLHKDFLVYDKEIKNFMVRNKQYLYKGGITCSSMGVEFTACVLPKEVTYGVNANIICSDEDKWWILAYLNSNLVTYIVRGILNRSNMITSGYVSRIPLLNFNGVEKELLRSLAKEAYEKVNSDIGIEEEMIKINRIVNEVAKITKETVEIINIFKKNLVKST